MLKMISLKIDPRMKKALEKLAEKEFSSLSGILKKASDEYLSKTASTGVKKKYLKNNL